MADDLPLTEFPEPVDLLLVVDVEEEVGLEGGGALEPVLEVAAAGDDAGELGPGEEAAAVEVVELVGHALQPVLDHVRHGCSRREIERERKKRLKKKMKKGFSDGTGEAG